jgi:hypothetical protein
MILILDFFFWGCLKDKVYNSNPEQKNQKNIPAERLQWYIRTSCLRAEVQHFQHLLWSVNCKYFIPNVIGQQACRFIGKIRMRIAARSAPVAVKRKAVNRST